MKKFVIISDSCCDLGKELREKYDVDYIPMRMIFEGRDLPADLDWQDVSMSEFYESMRKGNRITTAQITTAMYCERFEKYLAEGYDVLSLSCSSALSNSVKESFKARDELLAKYPDSKIICIDTLNACISLGILCIRASEMRAEGKTIEETAAWIEANRLFVNQECTVDKLTYLKQAGRVSATSAFFGGLLSVKPIIISDVRGLNTAVEKVKGRKTSIRRLVERFKEEYESAPYQRVFVEHADSLADAQELKALIEEALPDKDVPVELCYIGPIVGATTGPGTLAVCFFGKEVTYDHLAK